jgi:hypothetical protein
VRAQQVAEPGGGPVPVTMLMIVAAMIVAVVIVLVLVLVLVVRVAVLAHDARMPGRMDCSISTTASSAHLQ